MRRMDVTSAKSILSRSLRGTVKEIWEAKSLTAVTVLGLVIIFAIRYIRSPWRKLPPGPKGLPIIGNAWQLVDNTWLFSKDCKERFGMSLITFRCGCKLKMG